VPTTRDTVIVAKFPGGGLISYLRGDGSLMHTLNTPDGLARKLRQLGIELLPKSSKSESALV
jgi:predicted methyltransferase